MHVHIYQCVCAYIYMYMILKYNTLLMIIRDFTEYILIYPL